MYPAGTNTNVTTVANMTPKLNEIAIGTRNWACTLFSKKLACIWNYSYSKSYRLRKKLAKIFDPIIRKLN